MWRWASEFIRAEIRCAAGEVVVDPFEPDTGVDGCRTGTQLEIEIGWLVERPRIGTRWRDLHEHVVIDQDAVRVLPRRGAVFLQRLEPANLARLGLELDLLLKRKPSSLAREIRAHR